MEGQAVAGQAFGDQVTLVGVDGFAGQEKFEADFFGGPAGVERIKDSFKCMGFKAMTVILDGQVEVVAGGQCGGELGRHRAAREREGDLAASFVEPLPAVQAKVEDDLLDLGGIDVDPGGFGMVVE